MFMYFYSLTWQLIELTLGFRGQAGFALDWPSPLAPVCASTTWANVVQPCLSTFTGQTPPWGAVTSRDCWTEHRRKAGLCVWPLCQHGALQVGIIPHTAEGTDQDWPLQTAWHFPSKIFTVLHRAAQVLPQNYPDMFTTDNLLFTSKCSFSPLKITSSFTLKMLILSPMDDLDFTTKTSHYIPLIPKIFILSLTDYFRLSIKIFFVPYRLSQFLKPKPHLTSTLLITSVCLKIFLL